MDWMYKANKKGVNSEDYLLGKGIDTAIIDSQKEEELQQQSSSATVDMANKIREDPLFAIKQKEANKRKALLENPIRLKQLQQMLQSQVGEKPKKSKKKEKKSKREKKRKKSRRESSESSSEDDDSGDDLDAKLMEKLRSQGLKGRESEVKAALRGSHYGLIGGKSKSKSDSRRGDGRGGERDEDGYYERTGGDEDRERQDADRWRDGHKRRRHNEEDRNSRRHDGDERRRERVVDRTRDGSKGRDDDRSRDRGDDRNRDRGDDRNRDRGDDRRLQRKADRSRSQSPVREDRNKISEMSEVERERRRQEMMDNATWRDEQRKTRVEQYKIEAAKEDEMEKKKSRKADFFNPLKVSSHSTVEDRIKRNMHNIQRTKADLDKNFAKR